MAKKEDIIKKTIDIGGNTLEFEVGRFAKQSNAAVIGRFGDTIVLATVVCGGERPDLGYFPLSVEYQEKLYAGGKIKGSRWVKREGKPSDEAILNARLIDRSIRPLFPKEFMLDVQVVVTVLSVDAENDPDILALNTTSAALALSDIPWDGPIGAVRLGFISKGNNEENHQENQDKKSPPHQITGNFMVNPAYVGREFSDLDLVVSATSEAIVMVEAGANEVTEDSLLNAFDIAKVESQKIIDCITELTKEVGKAKLPIIKKEKNKKLEEEVKKHKNFFLKQLEDKNAGEKKAYDSSEFIEEISQQVPDATKSEIKDAIFEQVKNDAREKTLKEKKRVDSREYEEIRTIQCETSILPRTHGSAVFNRGMTQALTITTLAAPSLEQWIETMEGEGTKRYMHHYFFPPYSVGETGRIGWPSRREIGHGALAERALEPMIPNEEKFPYTIRVVSEIMSSNGSTSMASVCGSTLSLMDAGVPLKKPVAGIAMGLITKQKSTGKIESYAILSDIQGFEDHIGDMDFKVAGTADGVTALQMDVKIKGIPKEILVEALEQAKRGRIFILGKMLEVLPAPRAQLSRFAPKVEVVKVAQDQIGDVIGPGGRIIRQIMRETTANIDVDDEGNVTITGTDAESLKKAVDWVKNITRKIEAGEEFDGLVKRIEPFGAFIEVVPGKEGLLHVSKMADHYVGNPSEIVSLGQTIKVYVSEIDDLGRINLSVPGVEGNKSKSQDSRNQNRGERNRRPHGRRY